MAATSLTDEQKILGKLYIWIHNQAEMLRQQNAPTDHTGQDVESIEADTDQPQKVNRRKDSTPAPGNGKK